MIKKIKKAIEALKKVNNLEKKLTLMNNEFRLLIPDIIPINDDIQDEIRAFEEQYKITDKVNYAISKNDLMFRYACYHIGNIPKAYSGYLETGLNPRNIILKLVEAAYNDTSKVGSILDFASGYGRVTRFLTALFGSERVWASEIKPKALAFIEEQFKCKTVQSSFIPEEFKPEKQFDVIYVGSLFSHLPEDLFNRWLTVLYSLLTDSGVLILSTHDISLLNKGNSNSFIFVEESEDKMFEEVDDHIEDTGKYGATFIGKKRMKTILESHNITDDKYIRFKRVLSNVQDIYLIGKDKLRLNNIPDLTIFP